VASIGSGLDQKLALLVFSYVGNADPMSLIKIKKSLENISECVELGDASDADAKIDEKLVELGTVLRDKVPFPAKEVLAALQAIEAVANYKR